VPRLAGLQPLTIARQLYLIKHGASAGKGIEPMKPVVAKMNDDAIISISSYLGSLPPA
jgi:cytochrome c553